MRKLSIVLLTFLLSATIFGQYSKPIIDTGMLDKWPSLSFYGAKPIISQDGNYLAYVVNNQPLGKNTLVIQATQSSWRKTVTAQNVEDYFFCSNSKRLYWKDTDTLFCLQLGQEEVEFVSHIYSFKVPKLKRGRWIGYQLRQAPSELIVIDLVSGKQFRYDSVVNYLFNDVGNGMLAITGAEKDRAVTTSLQWVNLDSGNAYNIWTGTNTESVASCSFDREGRQISFMVQTVIDSTLVNCIWYYKSGMEKAILKASGQSPNILNNSLVIAGAAEFSGNGRWLFFGLRTHELNQRKNQDAVRLDIWTYRDKDIYPQQTSTSEERRGVVDVNESGFIYVSGKNEQLESSPAGTIPGDHIVVSDHSQMPVWWPHLSPPSYWLVSLKDGNRTLLKKESKFPASQFFFSPTGKWLVYWDSEFAGYVTYNTEEHTSRVITKGLPPFSKSADATSDYLSHVAQPEYQPVGWYAGDKAVIICDRFDIWKLDPSGKCPSFNITNGYGARHHIKLRPVYARMEGELPIVYSEHDSILLTGFNMLNKQNGFLIKRLAQVGNPAILTMSNHIYYLDESQKGHAYTFGDGMQPVHAGQGKNQVWIVQKMSATEFPNYFTSSDLVHFTALTQLQPQKQYNWLTAQLISWKQLDGKINQGVLYKPENFNPEKKYPVIFNYYRLLSHRLNGFPFPAQTGDNINIPWFVSRGYLVFTPDLHFSMTNQNGGKLAGELAINSIESAALYLSKLPYVDGLHMGIQGHSFGGGLTNYIVSHSKKFAAACSASGTVSDQISSYLGLARAKNSAAREYRMMKTETGTDRIGFTLWERPDLYIKASPVFGADKVSTPLLIMHNQEDGACDWGQSAELYLALRRLGKKVWMLQYDNESHSLIVNKNEIDFTIRLTQFFDHYLKGEQPPKWLTQNSLAQYKDFNNLFDLDPDGSCGNSCNVCKERETIKKISQKRH